MVKPHIEVIFMDTKKIEFSELSKLYSETKDKFPDLADEVAKLDEIKTKLIDYNIQINNLKRQKSSGSRNINAILNPKAAEQFYADINAEIESLNEEVKKLKEDDLFKRKDKIEEASNELNSYIKEVSTNLDFQYSLRESLVKIYQEKIPEMQEAAELPSKTLSTIDKLRTLARSDSDLSYCLSIDRDKQQLEIFNTVISQYSVVKATDPKVQAPRDEVLKALKKETAALEKGIASKGAKLQKYILTHKRDLGIPSNVKTIDFNDLNSQFYFISQVVDPKSSVTIKSTEELFTDQLRQINIGIDTAKKSIELAKEDMLTIKDKREKELQDLSLYPESGKWATFKRIVKAPFKIARNILYGKKHPFRGVLKKPTMPKAPTKSNVVDTEKNFLDAYKTDIGEDTLLQIANNYNKRIKEERQTGSRNDDSHDGPIL